MKDSLELFSSIIISSFKENILFWYFEQSLPTEIVTKVKKKKQTINSCILVISVLCNAK